MKKTFIYIACVVLISSCNNLSDDFFEFLFNSKGITLNRDCSNSPSLFSEGRSFEIYSMPEKSTSLVIRNILDKSKFVKSDKYPRYEIPEWSATPVSMKDSVYSFIHSEMTNEENTCFNENNLTEILQEKGNYYTFLNDDLGRVKLFIWEIKTHKLYLLTSYEL